MYPSTTPAVAETRGDGDEYSEYDNDEFDYDDENSMRVWAKAHMSSDGVEDWITGATEQHRRWEEYWFEQATQAVTMFGDEEWRVRCTALQMLGEVPREALNRHGDAVIRMLDDGDLWVRLAAHETLSKLTCHQHTTIAISELRYSEIRLVLASDIERKSRAMNRWSNVRAFVQVYPYAIFWYERACKSMCAPGCKWAERDRAAFEEDFGEFRLGGDAHM